MPQFFTFSSSFPNIPIFSLLRVTPLLRSSLKLGGEKICMNLDWKGKDGWQLVTKIPFNHKKNSAILVFDQNLSFLFLPVNLESGLTSLPFLLARSWKFIDHILLDKKNFISVSYLVIVFLCVGVIESQQSFTFFSWIQSLLFFTLFPRIFFIFSRLLSNLVGYQLFLHQNQNFTYHVNHQHCIFVITTDISIIMVVYSPWSSSFPSIAPCSNASCSSFLSKCCWQRLSSSSHQHQEEFLCLWLPQ